MKTNMQFSRIIKWWNKWAGAVACLIQDVNSKGCRRNHRSWRLAGHLNTQNLSPELRSFLSPGTAAPANSSSNWMLIFTIFGYILEMNSVLYHELITCCQNIYQFDLRCTWNIIRFNYFLGDVEYGSYNARKHYQGTIDLLHRGFYPHDAACMAVDVPNNPKAELELDQLVKSSLKDGVSVVALEKTTGKLIGAAVNKIQVEYFPSLLCCTIFIAITI